MNEMNGEIVPAEFLEALEELEEERHISKDMLIETIENALLSAYKKNYGTTSNVRVIIDPDEGQVMVLMRKDVVEVVEDDLTQISLEEAWEIDPRYEVGDYIEFQVTPSDFGRVAAQTAKQVIVQRIREEERNQVLAEFKDRAGEVVNGTVSRKSDDKIYINLDKAEGVLPFKEQVPGEHYNIRQRIKVYIVKVLDESKGPQVLVSRTRSELVKCLFEAEVPEIQDGIVEIKGIARDPGSRTKIAVYSEDPNIDPVGACVGTRGSRVRSIVDELNGEMIDIVFWSDDPVELISSVLSPADVEEVIIEDEEQMTATVIVPDSQLSLAIGKRGQNVSLAAKVSRWKIDIKSHSDYYSDDYEEEFPDYGESDAAADEADEAAEAPADNEENSVEQEDA